MRVECSRVGRKEPSTLLPPTSIPLILTSTMGGNNLESGKENALLHGKEPLRLSVLLLLLFLLKSFTERERGVSNFFLLKKDIL